MNVAVKIAVALMAALLILAAGVTLFLLMTLPSNARDATGKYANSPHKEWFASQYNSKGQWCCDESDGERYAGDYTINPDGSVTLDNGTHIEAGKVLTGPNPTGVPIWWHIGENTFCFALGAGI